MKRITLTRIAWALSAVTLSLPVAAAPATLNASEGGAPSSSRLVTGRTKLPKASLDLWKDPGFQREFAASYLAATDIEPTVTTVDRGVMQEFFGLMQVEKVQEAVALIQENRIKGGSSAIFDFSLGNLYFEQEELEEAEKCYRVAVDKFARFRRAWNNLGLIYVRNSEFDKALPALTKVVELGGATATTYGLLGFTHANLEHHLAAESAYRMAILLEPGTRDWKMHLARALFKQERFSEAASLCGSLIEAEPNRADLWMLQATAYLGLGDTVRAAENYELVDQLGGSTAESLDLLGRIYINEELFDLAVDAYGRKLSLASEGDPTPMIQAAQALAARGALAETEALVTAIEAAYDGRLETEPKKDLLKLRSRIAVAAGAGEDEARALEAIVELDPLDGDALILLGQYNQRVSEPERAIFYFERAANLEAFEADAKLRHAQLLVGLGRYEEALPLLRRTQLLNPRDNIKEYLDQVERVAKSR